MACSSFKRSLKDPTIASFKLGQFIAPQGHFAVAHTIIAHLVKLFVSIVLGVTC